MQSVYVIKNKDKCKIGISKNFDKRLATLELQGGFVADDTYCTEKTNSAQKVETIVHKLLKDNKLKGEWFKCDFSLAVKLINENFIVDLLLDDSYCPHEDNERKALDWGNGAQLRHKAKDNQELVFSTIAIISRFDAELAAHISSQNEAIKYLLCLESIASMSKKELFELERLAY